MRGCTVLEMLGYALAVLQPEQASLAAGRATKQYFIAQYIFIASAFAGMRYSPAVFAVVSDCDTEDDTG